MPLEIAKHTMRPKHYQYHLNNTQAMKQKNILMRFFMAAIVLFIANHAFALGKRETKNVEVGETFTVYSTGHTRLQSVLWSWDTNCLELVGSLTGYSTSATFKAKKATPSAGVVIQATVYYYASQGTIATGKFFDDWTVYIKDNSSVSLNTSNKRLSPGNSFTLKATPSSSSYSGSYNWTSSNTSVAYVSGAGNSVSVKARNSGSTTIRVTLDNGKYAECYVVVEDNSTVSLSETSKDVSVGNTFTLRADASSGYSGGYTWTSSNSSVASCSGSGASATINAKSSGNATINVSLSNGASASCSVHVKDVDVTRVTVSDLRIEAEKGETASKTIYPSNGTVKSETWNVVKGGDIISISSSGYVTAKKPGSAVINCLVNGTVRSNDATVTVYEPKLTQSSSRPTENATGVSVFINPVVKYSHAVSKGDAFDQIALKSGGRSVAGTVEVSGSELKFVPTKSLQPLTKYTLMIPRNAVINKWGSIAQKDVNLSFTTSDIEKASVELTPASGAHLISNETISIKANPADAAIYYTLDGSEPTQSSLLYSQPLTINSDVILKAKAIRDGWHDSDVVTAQYFKSNCEIVDYFPNDNKPLFNYSYATPYLKLSGQIVKSNNFRHISLTNAAGENIAGDAYLTHYLIVFVPEEPLQNYTEYIMDIPRDAVKTTNGEVFKGFKWHFKTRNITTSIAMQGDESVYLLAENGDLQTRGLEYVKINRPTGSFTFKDNAELTHVGSDIDEISGGFTHRLIRRGVSVEGHGLPFCNEIGTLANIANCGNAKKTVAGFQTSAIITEDNSLWLCGRNDFYQLGDNSGTTSTTFIKIADNVIDVALGNGFTFYVDSDNVLYGVGRNHRGQLGNGSTADLRTPTKIMDDVAKIYVSSGGYFSACITVDGRLLTWGDNTFGQLGRNGGDFSATPSEVISNIVSASLGRDHILAVTNDHKLYSWGANTDGQISKNSGNSASPILMGDNIKAAYAGPNTSLVLANSGKVTGWGRITHSNFSSGEGKASGIVIKEGSPYALLSGVRLEPERLEVKPECSFALAATPIPYSADFETLEWVSNNPDVATVDEKGVICTHNKGEAAITLTLSDRYGNQKECSSVIVCTDNPDNSGISNVLDDTNNWRAYSRNCQIVIEGAVPGNKFLVYNLQGLLINSKVADNKRFGMATNQSGVYIVRSNNKVVKVICR